MQLHRQRSSSVLLQKNRRYLKDAEKAKGEAGEKNRVEEGEVTDARKVACNGELERDHRQQHGHGNLQYPVELRYVDPKHHHRNHGQHQQRHEDLPDIESRPALHDNLKIRAGSRRNIAIFDYLFRLIANVLTVPGCQIRMLRWADARGGQRLRGKSNLGYAGEERVKLKPQNLGIEGKFP